MVIFRAYFETEYSENYDLEIVIDMKRISMLEALEDALKTARIIIETQKHYC